MSDNGATPPELLATPLPDGGPAIPTEPVPGESLAQGAVPLALRDLSRLWEDLEDPGLRIWTPQVLSSEELNNHKAILEEITMELVPFVQRQLPVLLKSLGLGPHAVDPRPKLDVTNDAIGKIATTLDLIHRSILSLIQHNETDSQPPSGVDKTYGALKNFRCSQLYIVFVDFASELYDVFQACARYVEYYESGQLDRDRETTIASRSRIIESPPPAPPPHQAIDEIVVGVSRCHSWLDFMMVSSRGTDLWLFQVSKWGTAITLLSNYLADLTERLGSISKNQAFNLADGTPSERGPAEPNAALWLPNNGQSSIYVQQLLYRPIMTILKLLRTFYRQLTDRPTKTKLNLGDFLSTEDMLSLDDSGSAIVECVDKIIIDSATFNGALLDQADTLEQRARKLTALLDHFIVTLAFHHVPEGPRSKLPPSESIFKPMFYVIQAQFRLAISRFKEACQELRDRHDALQGEPQA